MLQSPRLLPVIESARLTALRQVSILDTPADERFDRFTRMVRQLLDVPIAAISCVDEHRQWFKSQIGLDVNETSRDVAFCSHTILDGKPFVVPDASQDPRFSTNPLVTDDPGIRFYVGCPIELGPQLRIGTLCGIDTKPRLISVGALADLQALSTELAEELCKDHNLTQDVATGIPNAIGLCNIARNALDYSQARSTLLLVDVANLECGSEHDHDVALAECATMIRQKIRGNDILARIDHDRFGILMAETPTAVVEKIASRIEQAFVRETFDGGAKGLRVHIQAKTIGNSNYAHVIRAR